MVSADALPAYRLYTHIIYFAQTLSHQLLGRPPFRAVKVNRHDGGSDDSVEGPPLQPSDAELRRLERTLCRFEILCNLYRLSSNDDSFWDMWLFKLPRFELEQLSCLNDLLTSLIAPAFNDLVQHDVSWGYFRVDPIGDENSPQGQRILSLGLEALHALVEAQKFDERRRIIHGGDNREDEPTGASDFLSEHLQRTPSAADSPWPISDLPPREKALALGTSTDPDGQEDPEPARIFERVHRDSSPSDIVAQPYFRNYRRWGYVFWDESRLEQLGFLAEECPAELEMPEDPLQIYRGLTTVGYHQLLASRRRRSEIWRRGGSGWWSEDDETKVIWPERKSTRQGTAPLMMATSVQGAKDFLRSLKIFQSVRSNDRRMTKFIFVFSF